MNYYNKDLVNIFAEKVSDQLWLKCISDEL